MDCILCGSTRKQPFVSQVRDDEYETHAPVDFVMCADCGLVEQSPLPRVEEIAGFYPNSYRNHLLARDSFFSRVKKWQMQGYARKIAAGIRRDARILEIGFGNGGLLLALRREGFTNLYGSDLSGVAANVLKEAGIQTAISRIEDAFPFEGTFDIIILNNVIEHLLDPIGVLRSCRERLTTGGKIVLVTPNMCSLDADIFKRYWAGFHAPRHTYLFNQTNAQRLGSKIGCARTAVRTIPSPGQWALSFQNLFQSSPLTKTTLNHGMAWYTLPLSILFAPIDQIQSWCHCGGSLYCILER